MGTLYWLGTATSTAQEDRFTPGGTIEIGDKFLLTVTNEAATTAVITAVATGTTVAQVCADLLTAWTAAAAATATSAFCSGITASNQTTHFKLLGTAGIPFYVAATTTETDDGVADAQTFVRTATTACSGPSDWNTVLNWSTGAKPVNSDDVYFRNNAVDVSYGLNQSAVTLANLFIDQSYTGSIGTASYYLKIGATKARIGQASQSITPESGSGRIKLNFGTVQTATVVVNTNTVTSTDGGLDPVRLLGTHASNALTVYGGRVGIATTVPGEASTFVTVSVTGGQVTEGAGTTLTTQNISGGVLIAGAALTTLNQTGGVFYSNGTGAITTANVDDGGLGVFNSTGTLTSLNVGDGGVADLSQDPRAKTITNCGLNKGAELKLDNGNPQSVTITNGIDLLRCKPEDVTIDLWPNTTLTLSAV